MAGEKIIEAFRLLTACIGTAADPSLLAAAKAGPGILDSIRKLAASPPANYVRMADTLAEQAARTLAALPEKPQDADVLYVQMVELSLPDPAGIMADRMDAAAITQSMLAKLTAPEYRPMATLFRALTQPALERLLSDKDFAAGLMPAFMPAMLGGVAGISEKLDDLGSQRRDTLLLLSVPFEIERAHTLSNAELRQQLELRAEDYRRYRAQIEAIDERTAGLGNLKAAAREAVGRLDFEEVEALLARVDEVETDIAVETKVLRADNALLRGRLDQAYECYVSAARSLGSISTEKMCHALLVYSDNIFNYSNRYGIKYINYAIKIADEAVCFSKNIKNNSISAEYYNTLGNAQGLKGRSTAFDEGVALLIASDAAYQKSLFYIQEGSNCQLQAKILSNRAATLLFLGTRIGGPDGWNFIAKAILCCKSSIKMSSNDSLTWSDSHRHLALCLSQQAQILGGKRAAELLRQAISAFEDSLLYCKKTVNIFEIAEIYTGIGNAYSDIGQIIWQNGGIIMYLNAETAYNFAQSIRGRDVNPVGWALTQLNLSATLEQHARCIGGARGRRLVLKSISAAMASQEIFTKDYYHIEWSVAEKHIGNAYLAQALFLGSKEALRASARAARSYRLSLGATDKQSDPVNWHSLMENIGLCYQVASQKNTCINPIYALIKAEIYFKTALQGFDQESMPFHYNKAAKHLALAQTRLAELRRSGLTQPTGCTT